MAETSYKASRLFNKLVIPVVSFYLNQIFDLKFDMENIKGLKPPYIVMANHTNFWDPFLLSLCIPEPVHFVTSDAYFRTPLLRNLLKLVGAIPKSKFVSDTNAVKGILHVVRNNGIICIFPEGRRNWDGTTLPILQAPARLAKKLGLPVVTILFEGAHLAMPRWASKSRKGLLSIHCKVALGSDDLKNLSEEQVYHSLSKALEHNEYDWQRVSMQHYSSDAPAEKLELFLFCCPHCKSPEVMKSTKDLFYCMSCGYSVKYDKYGFFSTTTDKATLYFDNPRDWNKWQLEYLEELVKSGTDVFLTEPLFTEDSIECRTGSRTMAMKDLAAGTFKMYIDRLELTNHNGSKECFNINEIYGSNIQGNNILEFYQDKVLYRFAGKKHCFSAYKWVKALELLKLQQ